MQLTPSQIELATSLYKRMTIPEMALEFQRILQRPVSRALMAKTLSYYGIEDPKYKAVKDKTSLIVKLWPRGTAHEIAEYLDLSPAAVRMRYKRATRLRRWIQGLLFKLEEFTIAPKPMRIVHIAPKCSRPDCVQLSLPLFGVQQLKAA